jgi:uncharacterized membrane protein
VSAMGSGRVHGIEIERVEAAIAAAERRTSAELRVSVSRFYFWGDVRRAAAGVFRRTHMDRTAARNGVLLFVAPRLRRFAIHADVGVATHVDDRFWRDLALRWAADLHGGDLTGAIERALATIADRLALHFPPRPTDRDELPNQVLGV